MPRGRWQLKCPYPVEGVGIGVRVAIADGFVAVRNPFALGSNLMLNVVPPPGATFDSGDALIMKFAEPVRVTLLTVNGDPP